MTRDEASGQAPLDWQRVLRGLGTRHVATAPGSFVYLAVAPSTNTHARLLAAGDAPHGTVVLADEQTAGRGRLGRAWSVPPRTALTFSLILRPTPLEEARRGPAGAGGVVMATAVAVHDLACLDLGLTGALKWPNDLLLGGRKACGILVEATPSPAGTATLVVGIGLNVNATPEGLEDRATCLAAAAGAPLEREAVLRALLRRLDAAYEELATDAPALTRRWRAALETLGRPVVVYLPGGGAVEGRAEDVAPGGALLVRDAWGRVHTLHAGEVSLSPPGPRNES